MNITAISKIGSEIVISLTDNTYVYASQYSRTAPEPTKIVQGGTDVTEKVKALLGGGGGGGSSEYAGMKVVSTITAWNQEGRLAANTTSVTLPEPENELSEKILISLFPTGSTFTINMPEYDIIKYPETGYVTDGATVHSETVTINLESNTFYRFELDVVADGYITLKISKATISDNNDPGGPPPIG